MLTIGRAIGRSLRVEEMSPDEARSELLPILGSPAVVNMLLNAWAAAVGQPAFVTSTFAELTGAPPRTFLEWATDHAAEFRGAAGRTNLRPVHVAADDRELASGAALLQKDGSQVGLDDVRPASTPAAVAAPGGVVNSELATLVFGYDILVIVPDGTPSTEIR